MAQTNHMSQLTARMIKVATLGAVALAASSAFAATGIANTKHNLGTTGSGGNHLTAGTEEICVFCHTPHGANTAAVVPLWNKALTATGAFTTYKSLGTSSLDAAELAVGSVSLACLSCHDGTQAMDNMINAPGSGNYNATGASLSGAVWVGATGGLIGNGANGNVTALGTDLRNDHPIGIQYCGGWSGSAPPTTWSSSSCNDTDFVVPQTKTIASGKVWWVDTGTGGAGTREKTDMILYTRDFGTAGNGPSVECASCHDPHVETKQTSSDAPQVAFLRVSQTGSGVCLACHVK